MKSRHPGESVSSSGKSAIPAPTPPTPSRRQLVTSSVLLLLWILFLAWIALEG